MSKQKGFHEIFFFNHNCFQLSLKFAIIFASFKISNFFSLTDISNSVVLGVKIKNKVSQFYYFYSTVIAKDFETVVTWLSTFLILQDKSLL